MKLIDKDALVAEIERRRDAALMRQRNLETIGDESILNELIADGLNRLIVFIDTLEVKEVDLEKEIQDHIRECPDVKFPTTDIELIKKDVAHTAKKFFELGLKAQKDPELTRKDMAEIVKIAELLEIEWLNSTPWDGIRDWGFYAEVLTRYKAQKEE